MGYLITVYTDELDSLGRVLGSKDPDLLSAVESSEDPDLLLSAEQATLAQRDSAFRKLINVGLDGDYSSPGAVIQALRLLCEKRCALVGELDHFSYDEEDFPELWKLQFGGSSTSFQLPIDEEYGIPAVNHWPKADILRLREQMRNVDLGSRKDFTQKAFHELESWLDQAIARSQGLFVFYE